MARVDELFNYLQTPGLSDQQIAAEINRLGVTAQEVSQLTGVPVADVQSRLTAVAPAPTPSAELLNYLQTPGLTDQQIAAEVGRLGVTAQEVSQITGVPVADVQARLANPVAQVVPPPVVQPPPVVTRTNQDLFRDFLMTPGLTDAQIAAEMGRLGITNQQGSAITGVPVREIESRINATSGTLPFANATQAFAQDFNNYTSIPIGAQYNPAVVGGTGSPYSQIMAQMRPVGNPYAGALQGLPMGGYDPGIYDAGLLDRVVAEREAKMDAKTKAALAAQNAAELSGQGDDAFGGGDDGGGGFVGADPGGMFGGAQSGDVGFFKGGLISRVGGADPTGPDEGQINAQKGEYVIKKSSVKKYGKGLLDMINDGKIPAKKIKSLLD